MHLRVRSQVKPAQPVQPIAKCRSVAAASPLTAMTPPLSIAGAWVAIARTSPAMRREASSVAGPDAAMAFAVRPVERAPK